MSKTWILSADRAGARIFMREHANSAPSLVTTVTHPKGALREQELVSDKQGRTMTDSSKGRSAYSPHTSATDIEATHFAKSLADQLEKAAYGHEFDSLVLVAEPHFAGLVTKEFGKNTQLKYKKTIHHDYCNLSDHELTQQLTKIEL